jgi:hypothetical protein
MDNVVQAIEMVVNGTVDPVKLVMVVSQVYQDFVRMQTECVGTTAFEDVFDAAVDTYVKHVTVNNPEACTQAAHGVYPAAFKCYEDIVNQDFNKLTLDAIALVAQAEEVGTNCMPANTTFFAGDDHDLCYNKTNDAMTQVYKIYEMFKTGQINPITLVTMIEAIVVDA